MEHDRTATRWSQHPAAWTRDELLARADWQWQLDAEDIGELQQAVTDCASYWERPEGLTAAEFHLPRLAGKLAEIQRQLEVGPGLAWLQGLPLDGWSEAQATCAFWGLTQHIGTPISQTAAGDRLFHVRDERLPADHPQSRGPSSNRSLSFHTDRCDVIAFLCLRQAVSGGDNDVVSSMQLYQQLKRLDPQLLQTLEEPYLYQRHNVDLGNERPYYELPVFSSCQGHFACFLLRVLIERAYAAADTPEMTSRQREALDRLAELAEGETMRLRFRQQPGDVVFLNNFVTLHRRSEFLDHDDPALRRHLLRLWLAVPNSRPLASSFAAAFSDVRPGAIRGGMKPLGQVR